MSTSHLVIRFTEFFDCEGKYKQPNTSEMLLYGDDPSAGSPTETLLRLLLPLNDQV